MNFNEQLKLFVNLDITKNRDYIVMRKDFLKQKNFVEKLIATHFVELFSSIKNKTKEKAQLIIDLEFSLLLYDEYYDKFYNFIENQLPKLKYRINIWYILIIEALFDSINPGKINQYGVSPKKCTQS